MVAQDNSTPATQGDLLSMMQTILTAMQDMEKRLLFAVDEKITNAVSGSEHRLLVVMEDLRHDMIGTHKDKISQHEDRIVKIELHTGLRAA